MRRVQIALFAALGLLAVLVLVFALRNRQAPIVPDDPDHDRSAGTAACLQCHGPDGIKPRDANHPNGFECFRCHGGR